MRLALWYFLIFFFFGLKLSPSKIKSGLKIGTASVSSGYHVCCFSTNCFGFLSILRSEEDGVPMVGRFFFLALLPPQFSSSVVNGPSMAKGKYPGPQFSMLSISGIIVLQITPLWMGVFVQDAGADFDFAEILYKS